MVSSRAFVALVTVAQLMVEGLSPLWSGMAIVVLTSSSINIVAVSASDTIDDAATQGECTGPGTCSSADDVDGAALPDDGFPGESLQDDGRINGLVSFSQHHASNGDRLITPTELALHTTKEVRIWLSILGKVYDVTDGEDFYGALKGGYKFYAGRDASPCFSTGKNTPEGADEKLEEWDTKKQLGVYEWSVFYEEHEKYKYIGVLVGSRYFDDEGKETDVRRVIVEQCSVAKKIQDEEREKKKAERLAARMARKEKLANKN
jgi:hypothetical protein